MDFLYLAERAEARRTGLYFLAGPDPDQPTRSMVYVGEGDEVLVRLTEHNKDSSKDFWETAYVVVSKDEGLTKAHVRWLEARSIEMLTAAKRSHVVNAQAPRGGALPEADVAEMEEFLDQVKILLPALGFSGFEPAFGTAGLDARETVEFHFQGDGYAAKGQRIDGSFVVQAGAKVRLKEAPALPKSSRAVRDALRQEAVLVESGDSLRLTQAYAFNSPSQAAEVVCGFSINGRAAWATSDGTKLGEWEDLLMEGVLS